MQEVRNDTEQDVRRAILQLTPELLVSMLTADKEIHARVVRNGLPSDAKVIRSGYDPFADCVISLLESVEFMPVCPGGVIPVLQPVVLQTIPVADCV